jgi:DNA polymerase-1
VRIPEDVAVSDFAQWVEGVPNEAHVVIDTEFSRDTRFLTTIGLGYSGMAVGVQVHLTQLNTVDRQEFKHWLGQLVGKNTIVFQNSCADIPVLQRNLGVSLSDYIAVEDTMLAHATLWSDWPHTLEFLASLYGKYDKMKHLAQTDPSLYNWGDVIDTICVHSSLQDEFSRDSLSREVYTNQSLKLVPVLLRRMTRGIRVNEPRVAAALPEYRDRLLQASRLAVSSVGYPINIGSDDQLKHYLYNLARYPVQMDKDTKKPTTDGDAIAALRCHVGPVPDLEEEEKNGLSISTALRRIDNGADPILEARVIYAAAQQTLSHYLLPLEGKARIYPEYKIHAQASGRWSITNPPLAQLPEDLRDIIVPDTNTAWIAWDWDQIELRLLAALAQDKPYLDAFQKGLDVHAINAKAIFNTADEMAKDDPRRVFAKRFVYRLNYGGNARFAGNIPGARQLGLVGSDLVTASNRYLNAHPAMAEWRRQIAQEVARTHVVRTFTGRRRRLLGESQSALREAYNHPMQGGVADILNLTTIEIAKALPYASIIYTMHDSAVWEVPVVYIAEATEVITTIVTKEWNIHGMGIIFPAKFKKEVVGQ